MTAASIVAARRTAVAPRGGGLAQVEVADLGAAVIKAAIGDAGVSAADVDLVIFGNALYGGGNPARVAALAAGLPERTAALTVDTQCCAGLDAINLAALHVETGRARVAVAGGIESFSRAPIRHRRPTHADEAAVPYTRPPFTPWPERDPDMIASAAALAVRLGLSRNEQERYAIASHTKGRGAADRLGREIIAVDDIASDEFTRPLNERLCARLPVVSGSPESGLSAATIAVEADAAAAVVVVDSSLLARLRLLRRATRFLGGTSRGGDPEVPALAPIASTITLLRELGVHAEDVAVAEVMEAFAVQALACIDGIGFDPCRVNPAGGGLARGHPIGASGAILAVRLWHELQQFPAGNIGVATIAAAGGLGSSLALAI